MMLDSTIHNANHISCHFTTTKCSLVRSLHTPAIYGIIVSKVIADSNDAAEESRAAGDGAVLRINCGGPTVIDGAGQVWVGDALAAPGGDTVVPSTYIAVNYVMAEETADAGTVFETERYGASLVYNLEVWSPCACVFFYI